MMVDVRVRAGENNWPPSPRRARSGVKEQAKSKSRVLTAGFLIAPIGQGADFWHRIVADRSDLLAKGFKQGACRQQGPTASVGLEMRQQHNTPRSWELQRSVPGQ